MGFHCSRYSVSNLLSHISWRILQNGWKCGTPKNPQVQTPHGFPFHPYRSRDSWAFWSTCRPIPWRPWEQNQQHQWRKALQILPFPIYWNSHPARQRFMCNGNHRFNGKTGGIELPITNFNHSILTQWRASRSLEFLIISFYLSSKIYIVHNQKNMTPWVVEPDHCAILEDVGQVQGRPWAISVPVAVVVATQYVQKLTDYPVIYQFDLHKLAVTPTWHK